MYEQQDSVHTIEKGVDVLESIAKETELQSNELESINNSIVYLIDRLDRITKQFRV